MASTMEVGKKLVELCKANKGLEAIDALYAENIVSIEATEMPGHPQKMEGIKAVRGKSEWWMANHEVHKAEVMGPFPHGDRFICHFKYEVTPKTGPMANKRINMEEGALYTVKDGKIAKEEFFYTMG